MIGRLARRVTSFALVLVVCVTILLAACGCGAAFGAVPAERMPAAARVLVVMVAYPPGSEPPGSQPARPVSVTITDVARVRRISGLIDGLSQASPGEQWACPAFLGGVVNLVFKISAGGRTLAAATFTMSGCGGASLTIAKVRQTLTMPSYNFPRQVLQIAGIPAPSPASAAAARHPLRDLIPAVTVVDISTFSLGRST
jgi:hypothetical protein